MKKIERGIIVSIQGYESGTTRELAINAERGGAVAIRTDKPINAKLKIPIIGLSKSRAQNKETMAYITATINEIKAVRHWADYVAVDYRDINKNLIVLSDYCKAEKIPVIADIRGQRCLDNIVNKHLYFTYISTTFGVFDNRYKPDIDFLKTIAKLSPGYVIAEGGYKTRKEVESAFRSGADCVCIGGAISDIYKLTKKYTSIKI